MTGSIVSIPIITQMFISASPKGSVLSKTMVKGFFKYTDHIAFGMKI